ncbi:MarR family winged helix-turn-helix transcriptional regulator [Bdellovibrio sp. HCB-162]|uniref:MarR family winged helix-turn-helix transcriptional regulator n=1 Tax=Bdellovibrio sp. HCB-162 TaxID=3394234 RepID=UPI0039BCD4D3
MKEQKGSNQDYVDVFLQEWESQSGQVRYSDPATAFLFRTLRLSALLEARLSSLCAKHGITASQFQTLAALRRLSPQPLTAAQVMKYSVLTSGSVTSMIDQLQKKGLVKKLQDETDKRAVRITLTPRGKDLIEPILKERLKELQSFAKKISKKEQEAVSEALKKILLFEED